MGLFSWLSGKKEKAEAAPSDEGEGAEAAGQPGELDAIEQLVAGLGSRNGAARIDCAVALRDRAASGDAHAGAALFEHLGALFADPEPQARLVAVTATGLLSPADAQARYGELLRGMLGDRDLRVRLTAVQRVTRLPEDISQQAVRALLASSDGPLRFEAACQLARNQDPACFDELVDSLGDSSRRQAALDALIALGDARAAEPIWMLFDEEAPKLPVFDRTLAAAALVRLGDRRGAPLLVERLTPGAEDAPVAAEWAGRLKLAEAAPALEELSQLADASRGAALQALARLQVPGIEARLVALLRSAAEELELRLDAAEALAELGTEGAKAALREVAAACAEGDELGSLCTELLAEGSA